MIVREFVDLYVYDQKFLILHKGSKKLFEGINEEIPESLGDRHINFCKTKNDVVMISVY